MTTVWHPEHGLLVTRTSPPPGWTVIPDQPDPAAIWDGEAWVVPLPEPSAPVYPILSAFQVEEVLDRHDLLEAVEGLIEVADATTQRAWRRAREFRRDSPTIISLAAALGLTPEQVDALWAEAAGIAV